MPYDEKLATRVRGTLVRYDGISEKRMFGGICFMHRGNMCLGVLRDELIVRTGPDRYRASLALPHARPMDFTGRVMRGFVVVGPEGYAGDEAFARWVELGYGYAASLPPKGV